MSAHSHEITKHHPPQNEGRVKQHETLRKAAEEFINTIVKTCPPGPDRTTAIRSARLALMWGNAAVAVPQSSVFGISSEIVT